MDRTEYIFLPEEKIRELAQAYIDYDYRWQTYRKNGMTVEIAEDFWIVQQFINENGLSLDHLDEVARLCSEHYQRPGTRLKDSYQSTLDMKFDDPEERERILAELDKLNS